MFRSLQNWAGFVKLSHTVFALPFALASMMVAARETQGWPGWRVFFLIVAAMIGARTCAMAFNRIVDRRFDALNPRTARRHLPAGEIATRCGFTHPEYLTVIFQRKLGLTPGAFRRKASAARD